MTYQCHKKSLTLFFLVSIWWLAFVYCQILMAADWPQWRGPDRDEKSRETGLLQSWPEGGPPLSWKTPSLAAGYASVVVSQGSVFTIGNEDSVIYAYCLSEQTGQQKWKTKIGSSSRHAISTPTVDGNHLYALDPDGELVCLHTRDGAVVWRRDLVTDFDGRLQSGRGYGESPLIDGTRLLCTPGGADAMMVALDKTNGDLIWKAAIPPLGDQGKDGAAFSSIVKSSAAGIVQYIQLTGRGLIGIEAATGKFLWGYNDITAEIVSIPTPIVTGNLVFAANGYNTGSVLLKLTADNSGKLQAEEVYRLAGNQFQNHHGGVILLDGHIYGGHGSNNGLPTCIELNSGNINWKRRGPGTGSAAVTYADGRFIFRYQNGLVALLKADPQGFEIQGKLEIAGAGGDSWSHPVVANGHLFLREQQTLYRYAILDQGSAKASPSTKYHSRLNADLKSRLSKLGIKQTSLAAVIAHDSVGKTRSFYAALANQPENGDLDSLPVVVLKNRHLQSDGSISGEVMGLLDLMDLPFVLSAEGTQISAAGIKQLGKLTRLAGLDLQFCTAIDLRCAAALGRCRDLVVLQLEGTDMDASGITELANLPSLQSLDLEVCNQIGDLACDPLAMLTGLQYLNLKKTAFEVTNISDQGVRQLSQLQNLKTLNLYGNRISNASLVSVGKLAKLRQLNLSRVGITDSGLESLLALQHLEELQLVFSTGFAGPKITAAGLQTLGRMSSLQSINLAGSSINDEDLMRLGGLTNLRRLHLQRTSVTVTGIRQLQIRLPQVSIRH